MEARLHDEKLNMIVDTLDMLESKQTISKSQLLSLLGHLSFASRIIPQDRSVVAYLVYLAAFAKQLHRDIRLNKECRLDIAMWGCFLTEWNGVILFLDQEVTKEPDLALYTDATATVGYGGFLRNRWFKIKLARSADSN